ARKDLLQISNSLIQEASVPSYIEGQLFHLRGEQDGRPALAPRVTNLKVDIGIGPTHLCDDHGCSLNLALHPFDDFTCEGDMIHALAQKACGMDGRLNPIVIDIIHVRVKWHCHKRVWLCHCPRGLPTTLLKRNRASGRGGGKNVKSNSILGKPLAQAIDAPA